MATLAERLDEKNRELTQQIPQEILDSIENAVEQIEAMGVKDRALKEGDRMPSFELPDAKGNTVSSDDLLEEGPLALHFYRGVW